METDLAKSKAKNNTKTRAAGIGPGSILEEVYGNYKIRAGQLNGEFVARAFPKHSARSQGLMAEARGTSELDAIDVLKSILADRETGRTAARRWEERSDSSVPTPDEFLEALRQTNLSSAQRSILQAHAIAGEDGLSAVTIMNAGGYKSRNAAAKALAKAGYLMADFIGLDLIVGSPDGLESGIGVVGYRKTIDEEGTLHLVQHAELREAVWRTL